MPVQVKTQVMNQTTSNKPIVIGHIGHGPIWHRTIMDESGKVVLIDEAFQEKEYLKLRYEAMPNLVETLNGHGIKASNKKPHQNSKAPMDKKKKKRLKKIKKQSKRNNR
jgi:hypothetical protein